MAHGRTRPTRDHTVTSFTSQNVTQNVTKNVTPVTHPGQGGLVIPHSVNYLTAIYSNIGHTVPKPPPTQGDVEPSPPPPPLSKGGRPFSPPPAQNSDFTSLYAEGSRVRMG